MSVAEDSIICTGNQIAVGGLSGRIEPDSTIPDYNYHLHLETFNDEIDNWPGTPGSRENPVSTLFDNNLDSVTVGIYDQENNLIKHELNTTISTHNFVPNPSSCEPDSFLDSANVKYSVEGLTADLFLCKDYRIEAKAWGTNDTLDCEQCKRFFWEREDTTTYPSGSSTLEGSDETTFEVCDCNLRGVLLNSTVSCDMSYALGCNYEETIPPCDCARSIVNRFYFGQQYMGVKSIRLWTAFPQTYSANGAIYGTPGIC